MSTETHKRPLAEAERAAEQFRDLFPRACYEEWIVAGSVRRRCPSVGDIDHVIIPRTGTIPAGGLFAAEQTVNLMWHHLDAMVRAGVEVRKAIYGEGSREKWGERARGVIFGNFKHEIWLADRRNLGCILAIRTGPAEFSQRLVTLLRGNGWRNADGYVRPLASDDIVPMPDEETYFRYCGLKYREPEARR